MRSASSSKSSTPLKSADGLMTTWNLRSGAIESWLRVARTILTASWSWPTRASSLAKSSEGSTVGKDWETSMPSVVGSCCQISSLTKERKGCISLMLLARRSSMIDTPRSFSSSLPPRRRCLAASTYQSQKSFQKKA